MDVANTASADPTILAARLGQSLRAGRRVRFPDDTQQDFARRIGVSRFTLSRMENGDTGVALESWLRAAILLGVDEQIAVSFAQVRPSLFADFGKRSG